jgi:hypothetical protein
VLLRVEERSQVLALMRVRATGRSKERVEQVVRGRNVVKKCLYWRCKITESPSRDS